MSAVNKMLKKFFSKQIVEVDDSESLVTSTSEEYTPEYTPILDDMLNEVQEDGIIGETAYDSLITTCMFFPGTAINSDRTSLDQSLQEELESNKVRMKELENALQKVTEEKEIIEKQHKVKKKRSVTSKQLLRDIDV